MSRNTRLIRLSVTCVALTGFIVANGTVFPPTFGLSTPAYAVSGIRAIDDVCFWEELDWDEMEPVEQNAWAVLGWNVQNWDGDSADPASSSKDWDELSSREQGALADLGYSAETWDEFDSDDC